MRIPSGTVDQYIYFVAVDATDLKTRETGLSSFTVRRSRNGAASAAFDVPTVNETEATHMPGVYELLLDEDMAIASGNDAEEMALHITHAGMAPVTRVIELYRPKITLGETLTVASGVANAQVKGIDAGEITHDAIATDAIGASEIAAGAVTKIQAGLATEAKQDTIDNFLDTEIAAILAAVVTNAAGADIAADIIALKAETALILTDTAEIGAAGVGLTEAGATGNHLTAIPWNSAWDAEVQSECTDALNTYDPPTKAEMDTAHGLIANSAAAAVWDKKLEDHIAAGSFGAAGQGGVRRGTGIHQIVRSDTAQANNGPTSSTSYIKLDATANVTSDDYYNGMSITLTGGAGSGSNPTTVITDYDASELTCTVSPAFSVEPDATTKFTIWETTARHLAGGSAPTAAAIRAEIDSNSTQLAAILTDTAVIGAAGAGLTAVPWNAAWDAEVQSEVADALAVYDPPTKAEMDTAHGLLATVAKQDIIDTNVDQIETAVITNAAGADVAADIIALKAETVTILADTNELQADNVPGLIAALNNISTSQVNTQVDTALSDIYLDQLIATSYNSSSPDGSGASLLNELTANNSGTTRFTAAALALAPTGGSAPTVVAIREEMDSNSTQLAAIVEDTGTTLPATLTIIDDFLDTEIAAILVDTGTTLPATLATILADTNELQGDNVPGLIAALNNISTAEVNTQVDTALSDIHLDHLLAADYNPASKPGVATALLNEVVENDGGVSRFTVNALENAPSGSGASAATIADAVWDEAMGDHHTPTTFGGGLQRGALLWSGAIETVTDTTHYIIEDGTHSTGADSYVDCIAVFTDQSDRDWVDVRRITGYAPGTQTITVDSAPDNTIIAGDYLTIVPALPLSKIGNNVITAASLNADAVDEIVDGFVAHRGTATAGAAGSITLVGTASTTANLFKGAVITLVGGTGAGQSRRITSYSVGRVADIEPNWQTTPSTDSEYVITGDGRPVLRSADQVTLDATATAAALTTVNNFLDTEVAAILEDTGTTLPATLASILEDTGTTLPATLATILTDTAEIGAAGAGLTDLGGMSTGMKAEILVEALKVLQATAMPEPSAGVPAGSPFLDDAIMYLYMALRNKVTVTSTFKSLHNDAEAVLYKKGLTDSAGTFTEDTSEAP